MRSPALLEGHSTGLTTPTTLRMDEDEEQLQIDLSCSSRAELKTTASGAAERHSAMTWLQAAEHVLREEGGLGMHIRELTRTILELGMVKSSCSTSLETLLYRQTSKDSSKFIRVPGKMGWFGLKPEEKDTTTTTSSSCNARASEHTLSVTQQLPCQVAGEMVGVAGGGVAGGRRRGVEQWNFHPKVVYKRKKSGRTSECSASGSEASEWSSSSDEDSEALYHKRYVFTKKMAKSIIYENVALAEQLNLIEHKIATAEAEKQFLLEKYMKFNQKGKPVPLKSKKSTAATTKSVSSGSTSFAASTTLPPAPPPLVPVASLAVNATSSGSGQQQQKEVATPAKPAVSVASKSCLSALLTSQVGEARVKVQSAGEGQVKSINTDPGTVDTVIGQRSATTGHSSSVSSSSESECEDEEATTTAVLGVEGAEAKVKGSRRNVSNKVRRLHSIPLNEDASPVLPIQIGGLKVHSLGKIIYERAAYHSERYLLPVGFHSSRTYPSVLSPSRRTVYHCTILDGGDNPIFEMRAEDDADNPVQATSSTACQSIVLKAINKARDRQATNSGSGPEFFGYSNPTILNLLQKLPNAGRCLKYKFIKFDSSVKPTTKSKTKRKSTAPGKQRGEKVEGLETKKPRLSVSPKLADSSSAVSVASVIVRGGEVGVSHSSRQNTPTDPSLAPILGSGMSQLGLEMGMGLSSSSDEWSSSETERELTVDL